MTTATQNYSLFQAEKAEKTAKAPLSLTRIVSALFMVDLRESLDAASANDKSEPVFAFGL
jgi:hypothetical protein